jgi:hypothetical protein
MTANCASRGASKRESQLLGSTAQPVRLPDGAAQAPRLRWGCGRLGQPASAAGLPSPAPAARRPARGAPTGAARPAAAGAVTAAAAPAAAAAGRPPATAAAAAAVAVACQFINNVGVRPALAEVRRQGAGWAQRGHAARKWEGAKEPT